MKLTINEDNYMIEMANMTGNRVKVPYTLPFSFYFLSGSGINHSIRVKPVFNSEKLIKSKTGTLKLCDDWKYTPGKEDINISQKQINEMKEFFRTYLVLFCMVWDEQLTEDIVQDYFKGEIEFYELVENIDFYTDKMSLLTTVEELEKYCRDNKLVNFYGN